MSLWKIAWRSIQQRALASALTGFSMALGVALVAAVLVIHAVIERSFNRCAQGYDLIVGPKGSALQLVLNTVYYMGDPVGRIPFADYDRIAFQRFQLPDGQVTPLPEKAIPVCMGGNFRGFPLIGTTPDFFTLEYHEGEYYEFTQNGGQGHNFAIDGYYEAVIGSTVARETGLKVGDTFRPRHGQKADEGEEHRPITVVGIFAPTGTPNDRALFMNIEGFWRMHEHGHEDEQAEAGSEAGKETSAEAEKPDHHDEHSGHAADDKANQPADAKPAEHAAGEHKAEENKADEHDADHDHDHGDHERKISAILLVLDQSDPSLMMTVPRMIDDIPGLQAVHPSAEVSKLLENVVGNIQWVLLILAILVVVVAGVGILVSIYNSMNDRRHDIAVMRALGASRMNVMSVILMESILLSLGGGAVGLLLAHGLVAVLNPLISQNMGVDVSALQFHASELILIPGLIALASLVGYLPAVVAYRTDVARSLAASA